MHNPSVSRGRLATLTLAALGVVFGDIGTSPLYALRECLTSHQGLGATHDNVLGILSLIAWSLFFVVSVKYVSFIMRADNRGEGGIMALLALTMRAEQGNPKIRRLLILVALIGASLFYGDGMITPAISVLSAVEGLNVVAPGLNTYIIPITVTVLIILFAVQRRGTASVGTLFGPVMMLWFGTLAILGVNSIAKYPDVFAALNPEYAYKFFVNNKWIGFVTLGSAVLAVTGGEALYADMGHFGRRPIRYAWFSLVFPALLLNYFGQGALLLHEPESINNPFFNLAPDWAALPLVVLATVATIIASQAVISGVFSVTRQAIQLGFSPRMSVQHTSSHEMGQIYVPALNWMICAAVILLVVGFGSSSKLASAYGIAVTLTMMCDTLLAFVVAHKLWGWKLSYSFIAATFMLSIDFAYFSANALKIFQGGWFPLAIGLFVFTLLSTWKIGRNLLSQRYREEMMPINLFVSSFGIERPVMVPGTAVFMTGNLDVVPHALLHNLKHNKVMHERNFLLTIVTEDVPTLSDDERIKIEKIGPHFYTLLVRYGFMEAPSIPEILDLANKKGTVFDMMDTSFFLNRERIITRKVPGMARWRGSLFALLQRNAMSATDYFKIPANRVVELGTQIEL